MGIDRFEFVVIVCEKEYEKFLSVIIKMNKKLFYCSDMLK